METSSLSENCETSSNVERFGNPVHSCEDKSEKSETLGTDMNIQNAYKYLMEVKSLIIKLDLLARRKDVHVHQLRGTMLLSMSPLIDRIRGVSAYLEIRNLKHQFKMEKKKYRLKMKQKRLQHISKSD